MDSIKKERLLIIIGGLLIGIIAALLVFFGNPKNMGFCIACFIRDTVGGLNLQTAAPVGYIRPEIIGLVLGSLIMAIAGKEFKAKGGSSPITRFVLGFFVMVGALMFLGCPLRMVLRLAGGDLNALVGLVGFAGGIAVGIIFLKKGYSLKRSYTLPKIEGWLFPAIQVVLLVLLVGGATFTFIRYSESGPGSMHAAILISLLAGLIVGAICQKTRLCMVGGIRDMILFKDGKLIWGFIAILVGCLVTNLILTAATGNVFFKLGFAEQPVAHTDWLWNILGMFLVGFASVLLGGCPLRQVILTGEGNSDAVATVLGLAVGAAFCHNFGLASSAAGPTTNGMIAVIVGIVVCAGVACLNTFGKEK